MRDIKRRVLNLRSLGSRWFRSSLFNLIFCSRLGVHFTARAGRGISRAQNGGLTGYGLRGSFGHLRRRSWAVRLDPRSRNRPTEHSGHSPGTAVVRGPQVARTAHALRAPPYTLRDRPLPHFAPNLQPGGTPYLVRRGTACTHNRLPMESLRRLFRGCQAMRPVGG